MQHLWGRSARCASSAPWRRGFWPGWPGGLGTALADAVYAAAAAFGFAAFKGVLEVIDRPLGLLGGAFLLWLGLRGLRAGAAPKAAGLAATGVWPTLAATFLLTLANPVTILSFAAIFAGLGLARDAGVSEALQLVSGVFAGSLLWWALLSGGVAAAHRQLPAAFSLWVARGSGAVMIGFGLWALALGLAG